MFVEGSLSIEAVAVEDEGSGSHQRIDITGLRRGVCFHRGEGLFMSTRRSRYNVHWVSRSE